MSHTKIGDGHFQDVNGKENLFDVLRCECGADFFFAPSEKDKPIPLCVKPVENGNIFLRGGKAIYVSKRNPLPEGVSRYVSHFSDCPKAEQFRTQKE